MNQRIYIGKKEEFQVESRALERELFQALGEDTSVSLYNIYDVFGIEESDLELLSQKVLSDPVTDTVHFSLALEGKDYLASEFLPGQYDQRADSAEQCFMLLSNKSGGRIRSGRLIIFEKPLKNKEAVQNYLINPIEMRVKNLTALGLDEDVTIAPVPVCEGFCLLDAKGLAGFLQSHGLAMSLDDLKHVQDYFKNQERRDPVETELKVLDTYWSDHCRHTTFETHLHNVRFEQGPLQSALEEAWCTFLTLREGLGRSHRPVTLMEVATLGARVLAKSCPDLDESEENNACSIRITVDEDGKDQPWLLMFKNETHNHPTEIEPFGGASTCVGGAIRDPLSGRAYVYQAMRITGAGNALEPVSQTMAHKLPQEKISKGAAQGYSSYGNQIGLATSFVKEIYHEGYKAKRMEVGAVVGAVPEAWVRRESPKAGDVVLLLGGRTGRDGIGGATGSSKEHTEQSVEKCASEVQKGNAPIERRIQRLFRNPDVLRLIKKCNDFGAGGVSVAVGEIARGVRISLDAVPVKYLGLNGTELAISESQERMALVVEAKDAARFQAYAKEENLECFLIAEVTSEERLVMSFQGRTLVDIARSFLDTNGAERSQNVAIDGGKADNSTPKYPSLAQGLRASLQSLNGMSQRGMAEMFDASIGRGTVLMPYGGSRQLTEAEASVHKVPSFKFTNTCSIMSYGYQPSISEKSPYLGAQYAVVESLARLTAVGGDYRRARLSFQEYFERLGTDEIRWGKPLQALLGGLEAQLAFGTPAIGGKDSMSGTFKDKNVPPTLISFAVTSAKTQDIISPEFKKAGSLITLLNAPALPDGRPDYQKLKTLWEAFGSLNGGGNILSAMGVRHGGIAETLAKMSFGNNIGIEVQTHEPLFAPMHGGLIVESTQPLGVGTPLGRTLDEPVLCINGEKISIEECLGVWEEPLAPLYPLNAPNGGEAWNIAPPATPIAKAPQLFDKPKALIAIFLGSNCEYDTQKAFQRAGAETEIFIFRNLTLEDVRQSIEELAKKIDGAQIFVIPGGFSAGDEPDGSGKFIANVLQNPRIAQSVQGLLGRGGLILGICNGFQALVKCGLLPHGRIGALNAESPTLFRNTINRHVSRMCLTRISSSNSPWLSNFKMGEVHRIALSHGEGRFMVSETLAKELFAKGQVAMQFCDTEGRPSMHQEDNLNGAYYAIEGLVSPCGQILGKMGHPERWEEGLFKNISGNKLQDVFSNGVRYFKKEG